LELLNVFASRLFDKDALETSLDHLLTVVKAHSIRQCDDGDFVSFGEWLCVGDFADEIIITILILHEITIANNCSKFLKIIYVDLSSLASATDNNNFRSLCSLILYCRLFS